MKTKTQLAQIQTIKVRLICALKIFFKDNFNKGSQNLINLGGINNTM